MSVFHELLAVTCQEFLYIVSRVELILDGKMIYIKLLGRPRKCKINLWPVFQPQALCFDSFCLFKTIWFYPVRWKYKLAIIKRFQSLALRQSETPQFVSKLTHLSDVFVFLGYPWRPTTSFKKKLYRSCNSAEGIPRNTSFCFCTSIKLLNVKRSFSVNFNWLLIQFWRESFYQCKYW